MSKIIDDKFVNVTNDIEKVQTKPTMYISYIGDRAFLHLTKEIINNVIDENENENSIADGTCDIFYDQSENMVYVSDTGRGINFSELYNACTILHSGTKMRREHGKTAGENGVGLTATNALSEIFEITSYRDGKMKMLQFKNGKLTLDREDKIKGDRHGLLVAFKPSKLYLGNSTLSVEELDDWLTKLSFFMNPIMNIKFSAGKNGKDATFTKKYKNIKGISGFLEKLEPNSNVLKTPIVLHASTKLTEEDVIFRNEETGKTEIRDVERELSVDVAINFDSASDDTVKYSFCNMIENIEHGEHTTATLNAIVAFLRKKYKENKKKDDIEVMNNDILYGLSFVVNMETDYSSGLFTGQTKHKMDNKVFYEPIRKMVMDALDNYFKMPENKKVLNKVISVIHDNIRARMAASKVKKTRPKKTSFMEASLIANYKPPNLIGESDECEIYIVEGDSASGSAAAGRTNNDIQGVIGLTGKPTNVYGCGPNAIKNDKDLTLFFDEILGCGHDASFNLDNLRYKRILLMPDADVDGHHIMGIIVADIYDHARPLIEKGYVYRVKTPLYRMRDKARKKKDSINRSNYLYDKDDYYAEYEKRASEVFKLKFEEDGDFVSAANMRRFLKTNRDYYQVLDELSRHYTLHPDIIEFIATHMNDFRETIPENFPEWVYDEKGDLLTGPYNNDYYTIVPDKIFIQRISYLTKVIMSGNDGILRYHVYEKLKSKGELVYLGYLTIGQIMARCQNIEPDIDERIKGQGELSAVEMRELAMDPNNRILIQMTINDVEKTTKTLDDLFLKSRASVRKQMLNEMEVSLDDIDN